jgi:hypothetical protein
VTQLVGEALLSQKTAPQLQDLIAAIRPHLGDEEIWDLELFTEYEDTFATKGRLPN